VSATGDLLHLEDLAVGEVGTFGSYTVSEAEIIEFATRYNPLPYHTDSDVTGPFDGLVATGWQTGSIMMRLAADAWVGRVASLGGTGIDARFMRPVRPGDELSVHLEILEVELSQRSVERGTVRWLATLLNQDGDPVMTCKVTMRVSRRGS
jgi:acyl dehydratase